MAVLRYLSHPQVVIDPAVPVPDWGLSDEGRARLAHVGVGWLAGTTAIISSAERKARETAAILGGYLGLVPQFDLSLNEIDRSATGYLPHDQHEALADAFFAAPTLSVEGWERAVDVQDRGLAALRRHARAQVAGDLLVVGHGGIGTLIWCALAGTDSRMRPDQAPGGGSVWSASLPGLAPLQGWQPMERVARAAPR